MCAVSLVVQNWMNPGDPNHIDWNRFSPNPATAADMLKAIELLEKIDKRLGAIECKLEEHTKKAFKRKLKRRAAKK